MSRFKRKRDILDIKKKVIIFCEGECTERNYFNSIKKKIESELRENNIAIIIDGTGRSNTSIVAFAQKEKNKYDERDEIWVVFDEDTVKGGKFDTAISQADSFGIQIAYSNECFELWFLLHFEFLHVGIGREQYYKKLSGLLGIKNYKKTGKNLEDIFSRLEDKLHIAISNAEKLLKLEEFKSLQYSKQKPSTTVHLLVQALFNLRSKK